MIIRDAKLRDARGIAEVHVRSWQAAYAGIVPDEDLARLSVDLREQFWAQILSKGLRATFVLVNRDLVVGWSGFGPARDEDCDPILVAELHGIYLLPEYWSMGYGNSFTEPQKLGFAKAWSRTWFSGCSRRILAPAAFMKRLDTD